LIGKNQLSAINPDELEFYVHKALKGFKGKCPKIICSEISNLSLLKTTQRRLKEKEFIESKIYNNISGKNDNFCGLYWLSSGKPQLMLPSEFGSFISITNEDDYCVFTIGNFSQGCDLALISNERNDKSHWNNLLSNRQGDLLDLLCRKDRSVSYAGTRAWSIVESLIKARSEPIEKIPILDYEYNDEIETFYFQTTLKQKSFFALSTIVSFLKSDNEYIFSLVIEEAK